MKDLDLAGYKIGRPLSSYKILNRSNEININRLRLGQCTLKAYLHKVGLEESPLCSLCTVPETVDHILRDCPKFKELHNDLKLIIDNTKNLTKFKSILYDRKSIDILIKFFNKYHLQF